MRVAGVDGVPDGWVVCRVETDAGTDPGTDAGTAWGRRAAVAWSVVPDARTVLEATAGCDAVGVDIPLALPDGAERRASELAAVARLGVARAALFFTPPLPVLRTGTHAEACAVAKRLTGKKISMQTFHIRTKILDWQSVALPDEVVEAHPELSFRELAPDVGFEPKKHARGVGQRIAALARWIDVGSALAELPAGARMDDVLDALAAAWTAERWARGVAESLGGDGRDARGRPLRIVV